MSHLFYFNYTLDTNSLNSADVPLSSKRTNKQWRNAVLYVCFDVRAQISLITTLWTGCSDDDVDERWASGCDVNSDVRHSQLSFRDQLSELNVQMQQDLYISKLIEQSSNRPASSGARHRRHANGDSGKCPVKLSASSCRERRERELAVTDNDTWKYPASSGAGGLSARTHSRPTSRNSFRK